jgi:hypothetical protein
MAGCCWLLLILQPAAAGASWSGVEIAIAGCGLLGLLAAGCCISSSQQQPAATSHVKFLSSRVTFFMTNNFSPNPVFA